MNNLYLTEPASFLWICSYLTDKERFQVGSSNKNFLNLLRPLFDSEISVRQFRIVIDEHTKIQLELLKNFFSGYNEAVPRNQATLNFLNSELSIISDLRKHNIYQITYKYNPHLIGYSQGRKFSKEKEAINCAYVLFDTTTTEAALRQAAADKIPRINESTFKILCSHSTNINEPSSNGNTSLHWALKVGNEKFATILLEAGADCRAANFEGERPLHFAAILDTDCMVRALLEKKAYIGAWDKQGKTALDWATAKKKEACIQLLSSRIAS